MGHLVASTIYTLKPIKLNKCQVENFSTTQPNQPLFNFISSLLNLVPASPGSNQHQSSIIQLLTNQLSGITFIIIKQTKTPSQNSFIHYSLQQTLLTRTPDSNLNNYTCDTIQPLLSLTSLNLTFIIIQLERFNSVNSTAFQ
ncbi:hypothetical protein MJO29_010590 [Puccinia striiformis f. sp. tritici]|nr:hypothetical protein MJO29_010590 [Puccinia striiformis f. sp. tritici]